MPKPRDYRQEYRQRIARAAARGLSRSQARGHARAGEAALRPRPIATDDRLEAAVRALRQTGKLGETAKLAGVSPERLRRYIGEHELAERRGRQWVVTDNRPRDMTVISKGEIRQRVLSGFEAASANGQHLAAVHQFLSSGQIEFLEPFRGRSVIDAKGRRHPFETDPNTLHRLAAAGSEVFHNVYRFTA